MLIHLSLQQSRLHSYAFASLRGIPSCKRYDIPVKAQIEVAFRSASMLV